MNEEIEEDERRRRSLEERKSKSSSNETQEKHFPETSSSQRKSKTENLPLHDRVRDRNRLQKSTNQVQPTTSKDQDQASTSMLAPLPPDEAHPLINFLLETLQVQSRIEPTIQSLPLLQLLLLPRFTAARQAEVPLSYLQLFVEQFLNQTRQQMRKPIESQETTRKLNEQLKEKLWKSSRDL